MQRREFLYGASLLPRRMQERQDTEAFERQKGIRKVPGQGWFTDAGLGLFVTWGICTIREVELGWGFYGDVGGRKGAWPVENYLAQAKVFHPQNYDPDLWMAAAARAGFRYAVLTTRHHDGYSLWPSEFGNFSTKEYMGGRDLVRPYVEACRKHGLKVGLYYSPCNWLFNPPGWPYLGYPLDKSDFRYRRPERTLGVPRYVDMATERATVQKHFEILHAYVKGQVSELLTRYGKIDLLWWDGYDWPVGTDIHGPELDALVRKLQPDLVTNDRLRLWAERPTLGDFSTEFENRNPENRPEGAWEQCEAVCGQWSYGGPTAVCRSTAYILERLIRNRAWGGNYLPDFGPKADGTMPPDFYRVCEELAAWRQHSGESIDKVQPGFYPERCSVPTTIRGSRWYLHLLGWERRAMVLGQPRPQHARMLRTGQLVGIEHSEKETVFTMPIGLRSDMDEVIAVDYA